MLNICCNSTGDTDSCSPICENAGNTVSIENGPIMPKLANTTKITGWGGRRTEQVCQETPRGAGWQIRAGWASGSYAMPRNSSKVSDEFGPNWDEISVPT